MVPSGFGAFAATLLCYAKFIGALALVPHVVDDIDASRLCWQTVFPRTRPKMHWPGSSSCVVYTCSTGREGPEMVERVQNSSTVLLAKACTRPACQSLARKITCQLLLLVKLYKKTCLCKKRLFQRSPGEAQSRSRPVQFQASDPWPCHHICPAC